LQQFDQIMTAAGLWEELALDREGKMYWGHKGFDVEFRQAGSVGLPQSHGALSVPRATGR
jgi:hypothetical protein